MTVSYQLLTVSFLLCVPPCVLFLTEKSSPVWARPGRRWECHHRVWSWQQKVLHMECKMDLLCVVHCVCGGGGGGGWIHYHSFSATFPLHVIRTSCINTLCHHQSSVSPSILCVTINPLCHHQSSVSPSILFVIVLACVLYLLRANLTAVQGGAQNVGTEGNVVSHGRLQQSLQGGEMHYIHNYVFYVRT